MFKKIVAFLMTVCMVLPFAKLPAAAYTGNAISLAFSASAVDSKTGIPTGISPLSVPAQGTVGSPYSHGVKGGMYGKERDDYSFWFTGEWGSTPFIAAGGVEQQYISGAAYNIPANIKGVNGEIMHISFEMLHDDYTKVGFVEIRPDHADFTSGTYPYFSQAHMLNTIGGGIRIFNQTVSDGAMVAGAWNKFDYVFFTKYTTDNSTYYTAVDVYMNGKKVLDKLPLDADRIIAGTQLMTGLLQIRFAYNMEKVNGAYPKNTTVIDNVYAGVVANEPVITQPILSHADLTIDNDFRSIQNTSPTMTANDVINGLPTEYNYALIDNSGIVLTGSKLASDGHLRVLDKVSGNIIAIYKFKQPEFAEASYPVNIQFSKAEVNPSTGIPSYITARSVPAPGSANSPYTYGITGGKFGKAANDDHLWFTSLWDKASFEESGGISAANLMYGAFDLGTNITNVDDGIIHMSFEIAREGFAAGTTAECRPSHPDYTSGGTLPYFAQGNFFANNSGGGIYVFGQKIDTEYLPLENWNKFDYVFFTKYTAAQSAVDVYFNGYKVADKLLLDADRNLSGIQRMNGLLMMRFTISAVRDGSAYPEATGYIDNIKCGKLNRAPVITPVEISHPESAIDNKRRIIANSELGLSVGGLINGLSNKYSYEVIQKDGTAKASNASAAPGYLKVMNKTSGNTEALYKIDQQLSCDLTTTKLTILRGSINGFDNMTVAEVKADAVINSQSSMAMYYSDGTPAGDSVPAQRDMYIRVTAADGETYKDYPLACPNHSVGEISYRVWSLNTDGTYGADAKLTVEATIDSYTSKTAKNYMLFVGKYQNGRIVSVYRDSALVNSVTSKKLSLQIPLANEEGVSYKMFLWGDLNFFAPLKKAYVSDTHLAGITIACFGDSITGMGMRSYVETIQWNTGAKTINLGVGGARMTASTNDIGVFSMAEIATGMTTEGYSWAKQEAYANGSAGSAATRDHLANMKNTDLSEVDIVTIFYGTNDFMNSPLLDNETNNSKDPSTFGGAIRYSLDKLLAANPNLKIVLITPMYRDRQNKATDTNTDQKNSDQFPNSRGDYLYDYGKKIMQIADEYGDNVVAYDFYKGSGIGYYNHSKYLYDGLHPTIDPNSTGNLLLGSKFADFLISNF